MLCPSYFYSFFFACISALLLNTVVLSPNRSLKLQILCSLYLTMCAQHLQDSFLKRIGHKHPMHSFFKILSIKCSYSIFNREMICAIFESLLSCGNELTDYVESACDLLLVSTFMIIYKVRVGVDLVFFLLSPSNWRAAFEIWALQTCLQFNGASLVKGMKGRLVFCL